MPPCRPHKNQHLALVKGGLTLFFVAVSCVALFSSVPVWYVRIAPQDYTPRFVFWAPAPYAEYSTTVKESFNRHNVTLIYGYHSASFVDIQLYKDNYPNVKFYLTVYGQAVDGGFVWDGNVEYVVEKAKEAVLHALAQDLTNIIGVVFDLESPIYAGSANNTAVIPIADRDRHDAAIVAWTEFFEWMNATAPHYKIVLVPFISTSVDLSDGDDDLQYLFSYVAGKVDGWDLYAPMIYRAIYQRNEAKPYGDLDALYIDRSPLQFGFMHVDMTYEFYFKVKTHYDAIMKRYNDPTKISVTIGVTNTTCYSADRDIYEFNMYLGKGYDVFVRDVKIVKHFGIEEISLFLGRSAMERGYMMGGFFESYGDDALDRLIADTASTETFDLPVGCMYKVLLDYDLTLYPLLDLIYNFIRYWYLLPLMIIGLYLLIKKSKKPQPILCSIDGEDHLLTIEVERDAFANLF